MDESLSQTTPPHLHFQGHVSGTRSHFLSENWAPPPQSPAGIHSVACIQTQTKADRGQAALVALVTACCLVAAVVQGDRGNATRNPKTVKCNEAGKK